MVSNNYIGRAWYKFKFPGFLNYEFLTISHRLLVSIGICSITIASWHNTILYPGFLSSTPSGSKTDFNDVVKPKPCRKLVKAYCVKANTHKAHLGNHVPTWVQCGWKCHTYVHPGWGNHGIMRHDSITIKRVTMLLTCYVLTNFYHE